MNLLQKTLCHLIVKIFFLVPIISFSQQSKKIIYEDDSNFPSGKKGEIIQKVIDVINANDSEKINQLIIKKCTKEFQNKTPIEMLQEEFSYMYNNTGGVNFHSIRTYIPERSDQTKIIVKDNYYDLWHSIVLNFEDEINYNIKSLRFGGAGTPTNVTESKVNESNLVNKTEEFINELSNKGLFSGTILIAKENEILYERAYGEASKRFHVPNNIDTKFNLGSMNKMFTATSIMQLVEKKILKLDDPISKYINESWLPIKITNKITIHHLLSHTSGLGSYWNEKYENTSRLMLRNIEDYKILVKDATLAFEPGENFEYSNTGMLLLGVIIEKSTNQDYFDYIRQNIYNPSGMINSDSFEMDQPVENVAIGYYSTSNNKFGWENNLFINVIKGGPAGGGFSTVRDLHKFALALTNEKLVSKSSLGLLWKDHSNSQYGYGFELNNSGKIVGHSGGFVGINANLDIFLDNGYIVAVMSNCDERASPIGRKINKWIKEFKEKK